MNVIGAILFIAVGGIALHYWVGFQNLHKYKVVHQEKYIGVTLGILCIISGAVYLCDAVLSCIHFVRDLSEND